MNWENQRVLITGGAGFIGSHLTKSLLEKGAEILVFDNQSKGKSDYIPGGVESIEGDIRTDKVLDAVRDFRPNVLYHLAAIHFVPYCNNNPEETIDINTDSLRKILHESLDFKELEKVVYASSANVYEPSDDALAEGESSLNPIGIYGKSKLLGEIILRDAASQSGIDATSLRPFNVYGKNETNPHLIPEVINQINEGSDTLELGDLRPKRDFVHVSDVVRAFTVAAETNEKGHDVYNIGTGNAITAQEVVDTIVSKVDRDISIVKSEEKLRENDRPHLEADISKANAQLGWKPRVGFEEGIEELVNEII